MPKKRKIAAYTPNDKYFYRAQEQGYRARSAFKLIEIQERLPIIRRGDTVLDVGAAPGSFLQVASKLAGENGRIIGMDLKPIEPFPKDPNIRTFVCDVFDQAAVKEHLLGWNIKKVDVLISDLAPNTSGISDVDQWRSVELNLEVLKIAEIFVKPKGNLALKVFQGEDFPQLLEATRKIFERVKVIKPKACRDRSVEVYIVAHCKK